MKLRQRVIGLVGMVFMALGTGCASGPRLENYPRREMDRPFTLPPIPVPLLREGRA